MGSLRPPGRGDFLVYKGPAMVSLWLTSESTLNIGHRGASGSAPANTLAAFEAALHAGADGIELDVHLSADGVPVVIHDFVVDHTTDGTGRVADLPLAALRELDAGSWFDPCFAGERIPTLDEVVAAVGQRLLLNVEIKSLTRHNQQLAAAVVESVIHHGLAERVLISSFNPYALRDVHRQAPHLPLGLLYDGLPASWLARARAWSMRELTLQAVHPHHSLIRRGAVRRAHRRGRRMVAWTVDDAGRMRTLVGRGVDGIITNHPDRLRRVLGIL